MVTSANDRLRAYLQRKGKEFDVAPLTADASTREYFRIDWGEATAIACVYPEPADQAGQTYLDVSRLFLSVHLPVAEILDFDSDLGVVVQEDLGDTNLRDCLLSLEPAEQERLLNEAMSLIVMIQAATPTAFDTGSVASRLRFDKEKLGWELDYFKEHYFATYLKRPLSPTEDARLSAEFDELADEVATFASVLCHRDYHAANLMIDRAGKMRIIDHQDARIGSTSYDLDSLLLDRITELPSREWLAEKRKFFLDLRVKLGLPRIDEEEFAYEFRLQTIQRCLKAAGTFAYQSVMRGKTYFVPFIKPMLRMACRSSESLGRFPEIRRIFVPHCE
ncbi:MAG: phosphotransferase [Chloracidobacterium sp.]|nr:phosphotransferase [Chloracidobacterium sp.]